jgi:hypothetical protein
MTDLHKHPSALEALEVPCGDVYYKTIRVLQQWWEPAFFTEPGEWRDVPVEMEEIK